MAALIPDCHLLAFYRRLCSFGTQVELSQQRRSQGDSAMKRATASELDDGRDGSAGQDSQDLDVPLFQRSGNGRLDVAGG